MSLEYGLSAALNAVSFIKTMKLCCTELGFNIPDYIFGYDILFGVVSFNPLASILVFLLTLIMLKGIKAAIKVNNVLTICILLFY